MTRSLTRPATPLAVAAIAVAAVAGGLTSTAPAQAATSTFASTTPIPIGGSHQVLHGSGDVVINDGKASAYPIETAEYVDGLVGTVTDVNLRLGSFSHERPDDVDLMLVSPSGAAAVVMSDVAAGGTPASNLELVLDDEAPQALPVSGALQSTSYRPVNAAGGDVFPSPAPAGPVGSSLSAFDGTDPTGAWMLFVYDDQFDYFGKITNWTLEVTTSGPSPYPSTITVSGAPTTVLDVDVSLSGLSHADLTEVDMLLVGPYGQQATILSDAVGTGPYTDLSLVLDDSAPSYVAAPTGGTYRPTNQGATPDVFPAPAPAATGASALSAFNGTNPNGAWKLYVVDDSDGFHGSLKGWSLRFTTNDPPAPSPAPSSTPTTDPSPAPTPTAVGSSDTRHPRVSATTPRKGAAGVRPGANVVATLDEAVRRGTVTGSSAYLVRNGSTRHVRATVTWQPATRRIVIDPSKRLPAGTTYRVVVTTAVRDLAGNRLDQDPAKAGLQPKTWRFTTR